MNRANLVLPYSSIYHKLPQDFINKFSTIEQKWFDNYLDIQKDTIFHSGSFLLDDGFLDTLQQQKAFEIIKKYRIRRFSFDIGPCYKKIKNINSRYYGKGRRLNINEINDEVAKKLKIIKKNVPDYCELAIENLNYYDTGAYEFVCEPEFYNDTCKKNNIRLVLDIAHMYVTLHNRKLELCDYLDQIDLTNVREIHVSKTKINDRNEGLDAHGVPDDYEFKILDHILNRCDNKCDVVIEYYKDENVLMQTYNLLEEFLNEKNSNNPEIRH